MPGDLEPFEGEGRTGTVPQESFEPRSVPSRDANGGIDAEPTGGLPGEHVIGDVSFEQTMAVEVTEHSVAHGVLEFVPVGGREMGGLVELDRAPGILAEHAVDDTDMEDPAAGVSTENGTTPVIPPQGTQHKRVAGNSPLQ